MNIMDEPLDEIDNMMVWTTIHRALIDLGMKHESGHPVEMKDTYSYGDYKVTIGIKSDG